MRPTSSSRGRRATPAWQRVLRGLLVLGIVAALVVAAYLFGSRFAGIPSVLAKLDQVRHLLPLGIVGLLSWSVWLIRVAMSRGYQEHPLGYRTTTSVVVPAYREDPKGRR